MGMDQIKQKILDDARSEADRIGRMAQVEADFLLQKAKEKADSRRAELIASSKAAAEQARLARVIPARLEAKKLILETKQKLLSEVFSSCSPDTREAKEIEVAKFLYG